MDLSLKFIKGNLYSKGKEQEGKNHYENISKAKIR